LFFFFFFISLSLSLSLAFSGAVVYDVLTMLLLSKSMVVVLKEMDTMRAESKSDGRTVTVVRETFVYCFFIIF
jgi:hypothetical protein